MEEIIYRPPFEAESLLLQVTHGCSHNRCSFCTMYRDVPFSAVPEEEIEEQLRFAAEYRLSTRRVFLESGDAFALSADRLEKIAEEIHRNLPKVETIAMYASVKNIRRKSSEDLKRLRDLGINELNVGLESGFDETLRLMNKGYTAKEAEYELLRLREAGMDYGANIIFGSAGASHCRENAEATAELLNKTTPYLIFTGTIHADPGCPLYEDMQKGIFIENTFGEYLDEEEHLLNLLTLENCFYFGLHPSNIVPMQGHLQRDKEKLLARLQNWREESKAILDKRPDRAGEGAVILP